MCKYNKYIRINYYNSLYGDTKSSISYDEINNVDSLYKNDSHTIIPMLLKKVIDFIKEMDMIMPRIITIDRDYFTDKNLNNKDFIYTIGDIIDNYEDVLILITTEGDEMTYKGCLKEKDDMTSSIEIADKLIKVFDFVNINKLINFTYCIPLALGTGEKSKSVIKNIISL